MQPEPAAQGLDPVGESDKAGAAAEVGVPAAVVADANMKDVPAGFHLDVAASQADAQAEGSEGPLRVRIRDDGRGGADLARGSGLVGLTDRVQAVGGRLVDSPRGAGTAVQVVLPFIPPSGPGLPTDVTGPPDDAVPANMGRPGDRPSR